jgi:hypothetical protein
MWLYLACLLGIVVAFLVATRYYRQYSNPFKGKTGKLAAQFIHGETDEDLKLALYGSISKDDGEEVKMILQATSKNFEIDRPNSRRPYLCFAARQGRIAAVEQLLAHGGGRQH